MRYFFFLLFLSFAHMSCLPIWLGKTIFPPANKNFPERETVTALHTLSLFKYLVSVGLFVGRKLNRRCWRAHETVRSQNLQAPGRVGVKADRPALIYCFDKQGDIIMSRPPGDGVVESLATFMSRLPFFAYTVVSQTAHQARMDLFCLSSNPACPVSLLPPFPSTKTSAVVR